MSDEPLRKRRRKMERIFLCNDIWWDCLPFLSRAKVGFEFALVSDRFDGLADAHLNSKKRPWKLGDLNIIRENDQNEAIIFNLITKKHLALPNRAMPDNVIGFKSIYVCYIDQKVIDFLHRIRCLFQTKNNGDNDGIELQLLICFSQVRSWDVFFDSIWPLINPSAITKLYFRYLDSFGKFRRRISPTFLLDWANVRVLTTFYDSLENGENGQLLRQWLYIPRGDGNPKLLRNRGLNLQTVEQLKTEFLSAQSAVSFIIAFFVDDDDDDDPDLFVPFELDNLRTGERLIFRKVDKFNLLLARGPIGGRDGEKWAKWESEAIGMEKKPHNLLFLYYFDGNIGSIDEIAGPS